MGQNETDQQRRTDEVEGEGQDGLGSGDGEREGNSDPGTDQPEVESSPVSEAEQLDRKNISGGGGRGHGAEYGDTGYEQPAWSPGSPAAPDIQKGPANPNAGPLDG